MTNALRGPILGVIIVIAINAAMNAIGLSGLSFASLFPLMLAFWFIQRLPARELGFAWGRWRDYGLAIFYPVLIIGAIALVCLAAGVVDTANEPWHSAGKDFMLALAMSLPLALLTEEGFFRGWLFASLRRAGVSEGRVVIWTAIAFSLWHLPTVSMNTEDALPLAQIPVLLINAVLIGAIWGLLRSISGSILVTSVCHSLWNAAAYVLFGFGTTIGALGVKQTAIYGPESGFLGLGLNLIVAAMLWRWWQRRP
jgi:membrane protease YdiL (CAAX protease family)